MLQGTKQPLHLGAEGSSMHSHTEMAILTFTGWRCSRSGVQKQGICLNGPVLDRAQRIQELCSFQRACGKVAADSWSSFAPNNIDFSKFCQWCYWDIWYLVWHVKHILNLFSQFLYLTNIPIVLFSLPFGGGSDVPTGQRSLIRGTGCLSMVYWILGIPVLGRERKVNA